MIKLEMTGHVGGDAVVRVVDNWNVIAFSVAHSKKVKEVETTTWVDCSIWKPQTASIEISKYIRKGVRIWVAGEPSISEYTDKSGAQRHSWKLRVSDYEIQVFADRGAEKEPQNNDPIAAIYNQPALPNEGSKVAAIFPKPQSDTNNVTDDLPF